VPFHSIYMNGTEEDLDGEELTAQRLGHSRL
jgi:hypothetical protein